MKSGPRREAMQAPNGEEGASDPGWLARGDPGLLGPGRAGEGRSSWRDRCPFFPFVLFQSAGVTLEAAGSSQWTEKGADFKLACSLSPGTPGGLLCSFCGDPGQGTGAHGQQLTRVEPGVYSFGCWRGECMRPHWRRVLCRGVGVSLSGCWAFPLGGREALEGAEATGDV